MKLGEPDESGRRRPEPIEGSNFVFDADTVILAIGQSSDLDGLPFAGGSRIDCDDCLSTSLAGRLRRRRRGPRPGHAGRGDGARASRRRSDPRLPARRGATAEQRRSASSGKPGAESQSRSLPSQPRRVMPQAPVGERRRDMREIDLGYSEEEAVAEAQRCLNCGLCSDCRLCEKACGPGAIVHDMQPQTETLHVGAVIVTPGSEEIEASTARRVRTRPLRQRAQLGPVRANAQRLRADRRHI